MSYNRRIEQARKRLEQAKKQSNSDSDSSSSTDTSSTSAKAITPDVNSAGSSSTTSPGAGERDGLPTGGASSSSTSSSSSDPSGGSSTPDPEPAPTTTTSDPEPQDSTGSNSASAGNDSLASPVGGGSDGETGGGATSPDTTSSTDSETTSTITTSPGPDERGDTPTVTDEPTSQSPSGGATTPDIPDGSGDSTTGSNGSGTSPGAGERDDLPTGGSPPPSGSQGGSTNSGDGSGGGGATSPDTTSPTAGPSGTSPGPSGRDDLPTGDTGSSDSSSSSPPDTDPVPSPDTDSSTAGPSGTSPGPSGRDDLPTGNAESDSGGQSASPTGSSEPSGGQTPSDPTDSGGGGGSGTDGETGGSESGGSQPTDTIKRSDSAPGRQQDTLDKRGNVGSGKEQSVQEIKNQLTDTELYLINNPNKSAGGRTGADVAEEYQLTDDEIQAVSEDLGGPSPDAEPAKPKMPSQDLTATEEELGYDPTNVAEALAESGSASPAATNERVRQQAKQAEQQALESSPAVDDPKQVSVSVDRSGDQATLDVGLTDAGQQAVREYQRQQAAQKFEKRIEERTGRDVQPGEDFTVEVTDDGTVRAKPSEELARQQAAQQLEQQVEEQTAAEDVSIATDDLVQTEDGGFRLSEDAASQVSSQSEQAVRENIQNLPSVAKRKLEFEQRQAVDQEIFGGNAQNVNDQLSEPAQRKVDFEQRQESTAGDPSQAAEVPEAARDNIVSVSDSEVEQALAKDNARDQARAQARSKAIEQVQEQSEAELNVGEDFTVQTTQTESGVRASVQLTEQGRKKQAKRSGDVFSPVVATVEAGLSEVAQVASGNESTTVSVKGEGSAVGVAKTESDQIDLTADLGPLSDAGDAATGAGEVIRSEVIQPAATTVGPIVGNALDADGPDPLDSVGRSTSVGAQVASLVGDKETARQLRQTSQSAEQASESTDEQFGTGVVAGGLSVGNVPAIAGTAVDAAEVGVAGAQATASGDGEEFAKQASGQAAILASRVARSAERNPAQFAGQITGGVAASAGTIGAARALGGARAGKAASVAIQPGEELAVSAARRGLISSRTASAVPGVSQRSAGGADGTTSQSSSSSLRDRLPSSGVDVEVGPNAAADGRVEVNVNRGLRDRAMDVDQRLADARSPSDLAGEIRQSVSELRSRVPGSADVRQGARNLEVSAEANVADLLERSRRVRQRAQMDLRRARRDLGRDTPRRLKDQVRFEAEERLARGRERLSEVGSSLRDSVAVDRSDAPSVNIGTGRLESAVTGTDRSRTTTPADLADPVVSAGSRVREQAGDLSNRAIVASRRARRDLDTQSVRTQLRFEAERRSAMAREAIQRRTMDVKRAIRDFDRPTVSRGVVTEDSNSRSVSNPLDRLGEAASSLRDTSVRVDIGKPRTRTVSPSDLDMEGSAGVEFQGDLDEGGQTPPFEGGDSSPGQTGPQIVNRVESDAGDGTVRIQEQRVRSPRDGPSTQRRGRTTGRPSRVGAEPSISQGQRMGEFGASATSQSPFNDVSPSTRDFVGTSFRVNEDFGSSAPIDATTESEVQQGMDLKLDFGRELDLRGDTRETGIGLETRVDTGRDVSETQTTGLETTELTEPTLEGDGKPPKPPLESPSPFDDDSDGEDLSSLKFKGSEKIFDTGVVQSLDEL